MKALTDYCKRMDFELAELPDGLFQVMNPKGEINSLAETELKKVAVFLAKGRHNGREIITVKLK